MTSTRSSGGLVHDVLQAAALCWLMVAAGLNGRLAIDSVQSIGLLDFQRFYYAALAWGAGEAVYHAPAAVASPVDHWLTLNPPHFLALVWPFTRWPVSTAAVVWTAAGLLALCGSAWIAGRERSQSLAARDIWPLLLVLIAFGGTTAVLINGQVALLLTLPATLAWRAARREHWGIAGLWLGVCLAIKVFFLIFVAYLVVARRWRALATLAASTAIIWGIGLVAFGPEAYREWAGALGAVTWHDRPLNASLYGVAARVASPGTLVIVWFVAGSIVGLATLCAIARALPVDRAWGGTALAAILISPLGWLEYGFLVLGPALVLGWGALRTPTRAWPLVALLTFPIGLLGVADGTWAAPILHSLYGVALLLAWASVVSPAFRVGVESGSAVLLWSARPRSTS